MQLHDPEAIEEFRTQFGEHPQLVYCDDQYAAIEGADALILLTAWPQYWSPDYNLRNNFV